ncbi:MAG: hypothetical protein KF752_04095 [Pirellulaceae bacterium]|nr:hypothetical protein [Pirellulaceae bacterium]
MARYDDLDTKTIAMSAVLSSVILVILLLAGRALSYAWQHSYEEQVSAGARYTAAENEIAAQKSKLNETGQVQVAGEEGQPPTTRQVVPVDRAYQLLRTEFGSKPST